MSILLVCRSSDGSPPTASRRWRAAKESTAARGDWDVVRNLRSTQPTAAELFDLLWESLAELLGTAATATLVRRATKRVAAEAPASPMVSVTRNTVTYEYEVPESWRRAAEPDALRVLRAFARELGVLLIRLTGSVVVERLEREPRFRESGVSFVEASKRG